MNPLTGMVLFVVFAAFLGGLLGLLVSLFKKENECNHIFYPMGNSAQSCALCGEIVHRPDVAAKRVEYLNNFNNSNKGN